MSQTHEKLRAISLMYKMHILSTFINTDGLPFIVPYIKSYYMRGYPESKFRWAIKKNKNILQTMHIAI